MPSVEEPEKEDEQEEKEKNEEEVWIEAPLHLSNASKARQCHCPTICVFISDLKNSDNQILLRDEQACLSKAATGKDKVESSLFFLISRLLLIQVVVKIGAAYDDLLMGQGLQNWGILIRIIWTTGQLSPTEMIE